MVGVHACVLGQSASLVQRRGLPTAAPGGTQYPSSSPIAAHHDPAVVQSELTRQCATQRPDPLIGPTQNVPPAQHADSQGAEQHAPEVHCCPEGQ
ncbi:MAG: hypothetical protein EPO40_12955 [Myxococcaceae bacterium]|jgi:hypothetical protein|nr:MAG: hypothetical protein EPO40_12955 [Myxococcaceae bacterium]